jgi:hypothetical protein
MAIGAEGEPRRDHFLWSWSLLNVFCRPSGTLVVFPSYPGLTPWADICRLYEAGDGTMHHAEFLIPSFEQLGKQAVGLPMQINIKVECQNPRPSRAWTGAPGKASSGSVDVGKHTFLRTETSHPQKRKNRDLGDECCTAVEDYITKGAGPRGQKTLMPFIEDSHQ